MMIDLPKLDTPHPTSIWDYLGDMPYMPSKRDRERIEKLADERDQKQRVQIWDYFFRPRPEDVGKPVFEELTELQTLAATREAEGAQLLQQSNDSFSSFEEGWRKERDAVEAQIYEIHANTNARERRGGWKSVITGIFLSEGSVYAAIRFYIAYLDASYSKSALSCLSWILFLAAFPAFLAGVVFFFAGRRRLMPGKIQALINLRQKNIQDAWSHRSLALQNAMDAEWKRVNYAKEMLECLVPHIGLRIAYLEQMLRDLRGQIPTVPTADQVQEWILADQKELEEYGHKLLANMGDMASVRTIGTNALLISGPAEIQATDLIPPTYRGTDPDRAKYLHARKFGKIADGRTVRHYGVSYIELLYIGDTMLGRYSVLFDWIRGDKIRESAPQHHYADVVMLEMKQEYRKILGVDDEGQPLEVELESEPSMTLTLKGGPPVTITVPSNEYFEKVGGAAEANFDATKAAKDALQAITAKVKQAKQNLEVSQLAKLKEQERQE
jgi:hypothetical protein